MSCRKGKGCSVINNMERKNLSNTDYRKRGPFLHVNGQKLAGDTLNEANRLLDQIIEFLPDATFVIDCKGKVLAWNKATEKMTGVPKNMIIGRGDYEYAIPFYSKRTPLLIDLALQRDKKLEEKYDFIRWEEDRLVGETYAPHIYKSKGAFLWCSASILRDMSGNIVGAIESIRDITDRKLYESALKESETRFRQFLQQFQGIAYQVVYPTMQPTFFYGKVKEFTGYTAEDFISGKVSWRSLIHADDLATVVEEDEKIAYIPGYVGDYEYRIIHKDGNIRWLRDIRHFIDNGTAGPKFIQGAIYDNTQHKQAEVKLQESEARWQFALEGSGDGVWDWNVLTNEVFYSNQWKAMLGYDEHEIGNTFDEWEKRVHPEDKKRCYEDLSKHFNGVTNIYQNVHRILCKDGKYKWILDRGKVVKWTADGKPLRFIGTHSDITGQKNYEEWLKYMSLHDHLTGLYNRVFFEEEMQRLNNSREYPITIVSVDIDDLKLLNDTQGHDKGDELLKACAKVLKQSLRKSDILARIGGDEFVAILPRADKKTGEEIAKRIRSAIALYNSEKTGPQLSVSIGTATVDTGEVSLQEALKKSDGIMYSEKFRRRGSTRGHIVNTLLIALAERDYVAEGHARRISELCHAMGVKLGFSSRQLDDLILLAQVHDLGKVGIPDNILFNKGALSEKEWEIMRQHPEKGYRIALSSPELKGVTNLILQHHERWDGSGYPFGLKGKEIPMECRILAIADAYDAMTNDRLYRKARSKKEALDELKRCSGSQFDPELVEIFLSLFGEDSSYKQ